MEASLKKRKKYNFIQYIMPHQGKGGGGGGGVEGGGEPTWTWTSRFKRAD